MQIILEMQSTFLSIFNVFCFVEKIGFTPDSVASHFEHVNSLHICET